MYVPVCANDVVSSKPVDAGRDATDIHTQTNTVDCAVCTVCACGSSRCKACRHVSQGSTFVSNVTQKSYNVISSNSLMNCNTTNVIYLISCKKCGVQYVGETSQKLRSRLNNHRNRLRMLTNLYLYKHFSSDGHSEDDVLIMPIEELHLMTGLVQTLRDWREKTIGVENFVLFTHMV